MATIIIHSRTKEKISGTYCMEWSKHVFHRLANGKLDVKSRRVSKSVALGVIQKLGLVEAYRTIDGEIYDTPDGELKKLFPEGIRSQKDLSAIENIDK